MLSTKTSDVSGAVCSVNLAGYSGITDEATFSIWVKNATTLPATWDRDQTILYTNIASSAYTDEIDLIAPSRNMQINFRIGTGQWFAFPCGGDS